MNTVMHATGHLAHIATVLPSLTDAEVRLLIVIAAAGQSIRATYDDLMTATGMARATVCNGITTLLKKNLLTRSRQSIYTAALPEQFRNQTETVQNLNQSPTPPASATVQNVNCPPSISSENEPEQFRNQTETVQNLNQTPQHHDDVKHLSFTDRNNNNIARARELLAAIGITEPNLTRLQDYPPDRIEDVIAASAGKINRPGWVYNALIHRWDAPPAKPASVISLLAVATTSDTPLPAPAPVDPEWHNMLTLIASQYDLSCRPTIMRLRRSICDDHTWHITTGSSVDDPWLLRGLDKLTTLLRRQSDNPRLTLVLSQPLPEANHALA